MLKRFNIVYILIFIIVLGVAFAYKSNSSTVQEKESTQPVRDISVSENKVIEVIDGDTVRIGSGEKVRYIGINTPEKNQPFYNEAKQLNEQLVKNRDIKLETDVAPRDRNGRMLAYVYIDGKLINEEIIKAGYAVAESIPPNVSNQEKFRAAEQFARTNCHGMWKSLCDKSVLGENASCLTISGIHADASGDDNKNKNGEWIEISNSCSANISLTNFLIKDRSASNSYKFPDFVLSKNRSVIIHSGCGTNTVTELYWKCPEVRNSIWNNDSDHAFLYSPAGLLVTEKGY